MVPFERALVSSYKPSIVSSLLYLYAFQRITTYVLQHATFPHPIVSPKLPHVPLGEVDGLWATKRDGIRALSFQDFQRM